MKPLLTIALLLSAATSAPAADVDAALAAYERDDYQAAHDAWLPLAEGGSATAQFNLGLLHERGEGRTADPEQAVAWYVRAAENGFARAQYHLAEILEAGSIVQRDLVQARKWFNVAAEARYEDAKKRRKRVAKSMTPEEIALGDMWARQYASERKKN